MTAIRCGRATAARSPSRGSADFDNPDDGSPASEQSLYVRPDGGTPFLVHQADYPDPCGGTPQDFAIGWSTDGGSVLAHHSGWDGPFEDFEPGYSDCNGSGAVFSAPLDGSPPTWYGRGTPGAGACSQTPRHRMQIVSRVATHVTTTRSWRPCSRRGSLRRSGGRPVAR